MHRPDALKLTDRQPPISRRPSVRRAVVAVVSATAVAVSLVGCSAPEKPPKPIVYTCGEFLALTPADQDRAFKGSTWELYSPSGAHQSESGFYRETCTGQPASTDLDDLLNAGLKPDCGIFATLPSDIQADWLDAVGSYASYKGQVELTVESLLAACAGFQTTSVIDAVLFLADYPTYGNWASTSALGYTETMTLAMGQLVSGDKPKHPRLSDFIAGEACGYDPTKDAAIPFIVRVTNTTPTGPAKPSAAFNLYWAGGVDPTITAAVEGLYGGVANCVTNPIGLFGTEPIESGDNLTVYYFVILKNFFSPLNPAGAYGELAGYHFESTRPLNLEDGIADITTLTFSLEASAK
jgi:hypothetical protein